VHFVTATNLNLQLCKSRRHRSDRNVRDVREVHAQSAADGSQVTMLQIIMIVFDVVWYTKVVVDTRRWADDYLD